MRNIKDTYVITRQEGQILSFLFDMDGQTKEIHADSELPEERPGDLYAARVERIAPGLNAAFICYAPGKNGYLQLDTCKHPFMLCKGKAETLQAGDELIVQLQKMNAPPKRPTFTAMYELAGSYAVVRPKADKPRRNLADIDDSVDYEDPANLAQQNRVSVSGNVQPQQNRVGASGDLQPQQNRVGVSRKLPPQIREQWKELIREDFRPDLEILIRTNAAEVSQERVLGEIDALGEELEQIHRKALHTTVPCALRTAKEGWLERLSSLSIGQIGKIVLDEKNLYAKARDYLTQHLPELLPALVYYQDPMLSMDKLYSLETRLSAALNPKVWLKSGGFLMIEQTEALVSIDVNTGKGSLPGKKQSREEQFLAVNKEAAAEIARQLRLRSLSGIIIVDFVKMEEENSREQLLETLRSELRQDPQPCSEPAFTQLGLVEFTRKRGEKRLDLALHNPRK